MTYDHSERIHDTQRGIERHGRQHHADGDDPVLGTLKQNPKYASGSAVSLTSGVNVTVASLSITVTSGFVELNVSGNIFEVKSGSNTFSHVFYLYRDGTILFSSQCANTASSVAYSPLSITFIDEPTAGTHEYSVRAVYTAGSTSGTPTASAVITAKELGRQ